MNQCLVHQAGVYRFLTFRNMNKMLSNAWQKDKKIRGSNDPLFGSMPIAIIMAFKDYCVIMEDDIVPTKKATPVAFIESFLERLIPLPLLVFTIQAYIIHINTSFPYRGHRAPRPSWASAPLTIYIIPHFI